jgi:hypothetical protein
MWADSLAAKNTRSQFFWSENCIWTELLRQKMTQNSEKPNGSGCKKREREGRLTSGSGCRVICANISSVSVSACTAALEQTGEEEIKRREL